MAVKCFECKYDCTVWCDKWPGECTGCERLDEGGHCKCLMTNIDDCPDFVPKEENK